jgi:preprotein translocase subunit SecE
MNNSFKEILIEFSQELEQITTPNAFGFIKNIWMVTLVTGFFSFLFAGISFLWLKVNIFLYI